MQIPIQINRKKYDKKGGAKIQNKCLLEYYVKNECQDCFIRCLDGDFDMKKDGRIITQDKRNSIGTPQNRLKTTKYSMKSRNFKKIEPIRKFNRFELKYLLTIEQSKELKEQIKCYLVRDSYSWESGDYVITSLYYDSPNHQCYWEKVDGIKFRKKLRIRVYETGDEITGDSTVFVEIKQRYDKTIQKRRIEMKYKDALILCNERNIPEHDERDTPVIEEIITMIEERNLQPTLITSYFRHAYVGTDFDIGLRITFDSNIRYRINDLDLTSKNQGRFIISPNRVILEIKANERIPYWLTELIAQNNYRLVRISKYCTALEVENEYPRLIEVY